MNQRNAVAKAVLLTNNDLARFSAALVHEFPRSRELVFEVFTKKREGAMDLGWLQRGTTLFSPCGIGLVVANRKVLWRTDKAGGGNHSCGKLDG